MRRPVRLRYPLRPTGHAGHIGGNPLRQLDILPYSYNVVTASLLPPRRAPAHIRTTLLHHFGEFHRNGASRVPGTVNEVGDAMRMRGWGVGLVFWLGLLILGSQAFAASQVAGQRQARERRLARGLVVEEAQRLRQAGSTAGRADSTRRVVTVEGVSLTLEIVGGMAGPAGRPVRLRVLGTGGRRLYEHAMWIVVGMPPVAGPAGRQPSGSAGEAAAARGAH